MSRKTTYNSAGDLMEYRYTITGWRWVIIVPATN